MSFCADSSSELGREELNSEAVILRSILDKVCTEDPSLTYRLLPAFAAVIYSQAGTHPHFASLLGVTTSPGSPLCLLLEYSPHGTLDRFLWSLKKGPVPEWYLRHSREVPRDLSYHRHVACDLMKISQQVTDGMVSPAVLLLPLSFLSFFLSFFPSFFFLSFFPSFFIFSFFLSCVAHPSPSFSSLSPFFLCNPPAAV